MKPVQAVLHIHIYCESIRKPRVQLVNLYHRQISSHEKLFKTWDLCGQMQIFMVWTPQYSLYSQLTEEGRLISSQGTSCLMNYNSNYAHLRFLFKEKHPHTNYLWEELAGFSSMDSWRRWQTKLLGRRKRTPDKK